MAWSTAILGVPRLLVNKPTGPVWATAGPLADKTILHLSELEIGVCSTFRASNHKSTRVTPVSFASI